MREIKFKAYQENGTIIFSLFGINPPLIKNKFKAICVWTGLYDKNGNEIYEGDLVRNFDLIDKYEIIFQNGAFGYIVNGYEFISYASNRHFNWQNGQSDKIEVVGNIYEVLVTKEMNFKTYGDVMEAIASCYTREEAENVRKKIEEDAPGHSEANIAYFIGYLSDEDRIKAWSLFENKREFDEACNMERPEDSLI